MHAFRARSETARMLNLYSQAGFERIIAFGGHRTETRTLPPPGFKPPEVDRDRQAQLFAELGMIPVETPDPLA